MDTVLHAAFIGCGAIAQKKHLPLSAKDEHIRICALYNPTRETAELCKKQFGCSDTLIADDVNEIFGRDDIDIVFICSPNDSHAAYSISALESGKHVICEKPMAISGAEAKRMLEASERAGKLLHISYQNRYSNQAIFAKRIIENGGCGDIYYAKAFALRRRACPNWGRTLNKTVQGGGPLIDIGSHAIDLALYLADNYEPLYAAGNTYDYIAKAGSDANCWGPWDPEKNEVEDCAVGFVTMKNGMTLSIESSFALNSSEEKEASCSLYGIYGGIEIDRSQCVKYIHEMYGKMCMTTNDFSGIKRVIQNETDVNNPSEREHEAFVKALLDGKISDRTAKQACAVAQIVEALYKSAESRAPVFFD